MIIRRARYTDINEIVRLHTVALVPLWKKLHRPHDLLSIRRYIRKNFVKETIFVIEKDREIIGCGSIKRDEFSKDSAYLGMILIDPLYQGKGYGRALMDFLESYAKKRKFKSILLDVLVQNPAIKFYQHLDYGTYKLLMRKKLQR